jgi:hypothetical protein
MKSFATKKWCAGFVRILSVTSLVVGLSAIMASCPSPTSGDGEEGGKSVTITLYRTLDEISAISFDGNSLYIDNSTEVKTTTGSHTVRWTWSDGWGSYSNITKTMTISENLPILLIEKEDIRQVKDPPIVSSLELKNIQDHYIKGQTVTFASTCKNQYGSNLRASDVTYTLNGETLASPTVTLSETGNYTIVATSGAYSDDQSFTVKMISSLTLSGPAAFQRYANSIQFSVMAVFDDGMSEKVYPTDYTLKANGEAMTGNYFPSTSETAGKYTLTATAFGLTSPEHVCWIYDKPSYTLSHTFDPNSVTAIGTMATSDDGHYIAFAEGKKLSVYDTVKGKMSGSFNSAENIEQLAYCNGKFCAVTRPTNSESVSLYAFSPSDPSTYEKLLPASALADAFIYLCWDVDPATGNIVIGYLDSSTVMFDKSVVRVLDKNFTVLKEDTDLGSYSFRAIRLVGDKIHIITSNSMSGFLLYAGTWNTSGKLELAQPNLSLNDSNDFKNYVMDPSGMTVTCIDYWKDTAVVNLGTGAVTDLGDTGANVVWYRTKSGAFWKLNAETGKVSIGATEYTLVSGESITGLAMSRDENTLYASLADGSLRSWDVSTGTISGSGTVMKSGYRRTTVMINAISPDKSILAILGGEAAHGDYYNPVPRQPNQVTIMDLETGDISAQWSTTDALAIAWKYAAFSANGTKLFACTTGDSPTLAVFDVSSSSISLASTATADSAIVHAGWTATGDILYSTATAAWKWTPGSVPTTVSGIAGSAGFSMDGTLAATVATGSDADTVVITITNLANATSSTLTVNTANPSDYPTPKAYVYTAFGFSPDNENVLLESNIIGYSGRAIMVNRATGQTNLSFSTISNTIPGKNLLVSGIGTLYLAHTGSYIDYKLPFGLTDTSLSISDTTISSDDSLIVAHDSGGSIRVLKAN